jgi:two-component system response regulator YesN
MNGLEDLFQHISVDLLHRILTSFDTATGMHAIIVNRDGIPQIPDGFQGNCRFCRIIQNDPVGVNKCCGSYARAGIQAAQFGEPYIFRCHAGLVAFAAPIIIDGEHQGSIICGQVLMWEPEDFFWEEIAEMTSGLNIRNNVLIEAAKEMSVCSQSKVQAAAQLLFMVANQIMQGSVLALQQRQEIAKHQAQLGEEIQARKQLERQLSVVQGKVYGNYSLQKERDLLAKVRLGDREQSNRLLKELLADVVEEYGARPRHFKARIIELLVLISRSAVEGGAELDRLLRWNYGYIERISRTEEIDVLCGCIFDALGSYVSAIFNNSEAKNKQFVETAARIIRQRYRESGLTLNDVARSVYISPYYLSHIFSHEMGCTVIDYLTRVRLEEAKKLLQSSKLSIVAIAEQVGYSDSGYFSRVFKKNQGMTPSEYKKQDAGRSKGGKGKKEGVS